MYQHRRASTSYLVTRLYVEYLTRTKHTSVDKNIVTLDNRTSVAWAWGWRGGMSSEKIHLLTGEGLWQTVGGLQHISSGDPLEDHTFLWPQLSITGRWRLAGLHQSAWRCIRARHETVALTWTSKSNLDPYTELLTFSLRCWSTLIASSRSMQVFQNSYLTISRNTLPVMTPGHPSLTCNHHHFLFGLAAIGS